MRYAAALLGFLLALGSVASARGQQDRPWWAAFEMGAGQLKLSSNQQSGNRATTFALGFAGGHRITPWARAGLHVNGWLLQASNLNDPAVGESVSVVNGVLDVFPVRNKRLFVRGGGGVSMYTNNRPTGSMGTGPGWEAGGGYEFRLPGNFGITPMIEYASGTLGDAVYSLPPATGGRYSVVEFKAAFLYRFGGRKK